MTNKTWHIGLFLLTAGLLVGCSHGNDPTEPTTTTNKEITLKTRVSTMLKRLTTVNDNSALQGYDLKIDAYFHGTSTKYLDGKKLHYDLGHSPSPAWVFWSGSAQEHYYWPAEGSVYDPSSAHITVSSLDFVGYCPYTTPTYITPEVYDPIHSAASFSCDLGDYMTAGQTDLQEYLIAVKNSQTLATQTANNGVPLVFKHPFALIKFVIAEGSGTAVTVDSIGISDLYTTAKCTYNDTTMTWSNHAAAAAMSQNSLNLKYGTATTETLPFMVIPYAYGTKTLTIKGTWTDWSNPLTKNLSAEVNLDWQPGYIYTYTLTVTKYALIVNTTKYTEQW